MDYPDAVAACIAAWGAGTGALGRQGLADQVASEAVSLLLAVLGGGAGAILVGAFFKRSLVRAAQLVLAAFGVAGIIVFASDFRALGNALEDCLEAAARAEAQGPRGGRRASDGGAEPGRRPHAPGVHSRRIRRSCASTVTVAAVPARMPASRSSESSGRGSGAPRSSSSGRTGAGPDST